MIFSAVTSDLDPSFIAGVGRPVESKDTRGGVKAMHQETLNLLTNLDCRNNTIFKKLHDFSKNSTKTNCLIFLYRGCVLIM